MKTVVAILFTLFAAMPTFAQSLSNGQSTDVVSNSGASNQGVNTTFNSYGTPLSLVNSVGRQDLHTNQSMAVPPAFSTPAVMGTCATAGWGIGGQVASGGLSFAGKGGVDAGCDLQRDLTILRELGAGIEVAKQRACAKPEIAKAMADAGTPCRTAAEVSAILEGTPAPVATRKPMPGYMAGG